MVQYKSDRHTDIMIKLRELRSDGDLCDVTLTVGQNEIQAHRCVLAAGSEYFKTLFLGQFKEASMQNLDLSEVTDNVNNLDEIVDFIYTGEIDINDDNLEVLVKLSTYLLIASLTDHCMKFMRDHCSLKTCLDHYFCSLEHGLKKVEKEKQLMVASRFHDYFIHEDNLDLTPDEVQLLLSKNMFQHCTVSSILQFMIKWLTDEITDQHVSVANQILDTVASKITDNLSQQQKFESRKMLIIIEENFQNNRGCNVKIFMDKLQKISVEILATHLTESNSCQENLESSSASMRDICTDYEEVIVTLSPKQCIVDEFNNMHWRHKVKKSFTEPIFTLCCYIPSTKTWHHIQDLETEEVIANLPQRFGESFTMVSVLYKEELVLIRGYICDKVYFYHLRNKSWRITDLSAMKSRESRGYWIGVSDYCMVEGNNCLYLIVKVMQEKDYGEAPVKEYFLGLKLRDDGTPVLKEVFKTEKETDYPCDYCELQAKISTVSNELIFTSGPQMSTSCTSRSECGFSYVFVVNLNDEKPVPVNLLREFAEEPEKGLTGVRIMQTESHFYIINDGTVESQTRDVRSIYKYKFHSQHLIKLQQGSNRQDGETIMFNKTKTLDGSSPQNADRNETNLPGDETKGHCDSETGLRINHREGKEEVVFPCCEEFTTSNRNTLWSFEGDRHYFSRLHEVQIEEGGKLTHGEHTPPPFSCVTNMAVGKLPDDLVSQLAQPPVQSFLHRTCPSYNSLL